MKLKSLRHLAEDVSVSLCLCLSANSEWLGLKGKHKDENVPGNEKTVKYRNKRHVWNFLASPNFTV